MLRVKAFNSAACEDNIGELERLINVWLSSTQARVRHVTQSAFGTHLVLSFVYEATEEAQVEVAEAEAAVPEVFENSLQDAELDPQELDSPTLPQAELPY